MTNEAQMENNGSFPVANNDTRQIKIGAVLSYATILFNIVSGLVYTPWMIRQIGKEDYGLFALVGSFLTYFVMDFGLGNSITRFISKYRAENRPEAVDELIGLTTKLYLLIDLVLLLAVIILFFFIENLFVKLTPSEIVKFKIIYCIAGLFSVISFPFIPLNSILTAFEKFFTLKLCIFLNKVFTVGLMVIALFAGYKLYALVAINALVGLCLLIFKFWYVFRKCPVKIRLSFFNMNLLKQVLAYSVWVTVIGIAQRMLINIVPVLLGIFSGTKEIAIFSIGMTIEAYTWMFAVALGGLFMPKVSRMVAKEKREDIIKLMIKVGRIQLMIVGIIVIGFITLGQQFLSLWIGNDFERSYWVVLFIMIPGLVTFTQEIAYTLLYVENKIKYWGILLLSASLLTFLISILLCPHYGAVGSAIGISVAYILCHGIGMNIVFSRILKIDIGRYFYECHFKFMFPFLITLGIGFSFRRIFPTDHLVFFIITAFVLLLMYIVLMWNLALNISEKSIVKSLVRRALILKYNKRNK